MLIYSCTDLIFASKIAGTAEALSTPARPARDAVAMQKRLDRVDDGKCNDPVDSVMIDLDLADTALALIQQVKQHDATIRVIAFGSHVATDALQAARDQGADYVMTRGSFTTNLPTMIEQLAKKS